MAIWKKSNSWKGAHTRVGLHTLDRTHCVSTVGREFIYIVYCRSPLSAQWWKLIPLRLTFLSYYWISDRISLKMRAGMFAESDRLGVLGERRQISLNKKKKVGNKMKSEVENPQKIKRRWKFGEIQFSWRERVEQSRKVYVFLILFTHQCRRGERESWL